MIKLKLQFWGEGAIKQYFQFLYDGGMDIFLNVPDLEQL